MSSITGPDCVVTCNLTLHARAHTYVCMYVHTREWLQAGAGSSTPLHGEMSSAGGGGGRSGTPGTETDVMNPEESRILLGQAVVGNDSRGGGGGGDSLGLLPPQPGDGSVLSPVDSMSSSSATGTRAESLRSASGSVTTGAAEGPHRRRTREPNSFK